MVALHHVLLGLSAAALAAAGLRLAALTGASGMVRGLAAVVLAATAACLCALLLGLVGLGASPIALPLAAAGLWLIARARLAEPDPAPRAQAAAAWRALPLGGRLLVGALAGAWLAWTVWLLRHPALGYDTVAYHLPEIVRFVQEGTPGSVETILLSLPVGSYPLTNEVLLAWASGIARSLVPVTAWAPAMLLLLAAAGWSGLRALRVPRLPAGLAVAAICVTPVLTHHQQNGAYTDLPALAWLVTQAALAVHVRRHPALLAPVLLAAALAVGTKTTVAPLALVVLAAAAWPVRDRLARLAWPLGLAAAAAVAVGGFWYLRNLADHGSPFWPIVTTPWGDPVPDIVERVDTRFLERPVATIDALADDYADLVAGGLLLVAAALLAPLVARTRAVAAAAAATAAALLAWTLAPLTGVPDERVLEVVSVSSLRYLVPTLAAAALTLALAARDAPRLRALPTAVLAAATALGGWQTLELGYPSVPRLTTLLAGATAGIAAEAVLHLAGSRAAPGAGSRGPGPAGDAARRGRRRLAGDGAWLGAAAAVAAGLLLAAGAPGLAGRHAETGLYDAEVVRWAADRSEFTEGDGPIAMAPLTLGVLAGDRLQHRLDLVPAGEPCRLTRRRLDGGWVVQQLPSPPGVAITRCLEGARPEALGGQSYRVLGSG